MRAGFSEPDTNTAEHRERRGHRDKPGIGRVWHTGKRRLRHIAENPEGRVVAVEQVLNEGEQLDIIGKLIRRMEIDYP
jgi:hypothetical protein